MSVFNKLPYSLRSQGDNSFSIKLIILFNFVLFPRIIENFKIWDFDLTDEDMAAMSDLNVGWRHLVWAETSMHPDYPYKEDLPWNYQVSQPGKGATAGAK